MQDKLQWTIKGIKPETRDLVRAAAKKRKLTISSFLDEELGKICSEILLNDDNSIDYSNKVAINQILDKIATIEEKMEIIEIEGKKGFFRKLTS